jgi:hypothetical protein
MNRSADEPLSESAGQSSRPSSAAVVLVVELRRRPSPLGRLPHDDAPARFAVVGGVVTFGFVVGFVVVAARFGVVRTGGCVSSVLSSVGSSGSGAAASVDSGGGGVASVGGSDAVAVVAGSVAAVDEARLVDVAPVEVVPAATVPGGRMVDGSSSVVKRSEPTFVAGPRSPRASRRTLAAPAALAASATVPAVARPTRIFFTPTLLRYV